MAKEKKLSDQIRDLWDVDDPIDVDTPLDDAVYIDTDSLNKEAKDESILMIRDLEKIYSNKEFMDAHPDYKKRLDIELESLRILIKMRKSDEVTHDILVKQIGMTPNNASLYQALSKLQTSLLNIHTKLDDTVKTINQLLKNYQLELPFEKEENETVNTETGEVKQNARSFRGTKAFMNHMISNGKVSAIDDDGNLLNQMSLFEEDLPKEETA